MVSVYYIQKRLTQSAIRFCLKKDTSLKKDTEMDSL